VPARGESDTAFAAENEASRPETSEGDFHFFEEFPMSVCPPVWMKTERSNCHAEGASATGASRFVTNEILRLLCLLIVTLRDLASL
jgi:hypothetical protein